MKKTDYQKELGFKYPSITVKFINDYEELQEQNQETQTAKEISDLQAKILELIPDGLDANNLTEQQLLSKFDNESRKKVLELQKQIVALNKKRKRENREYNIKLIEMVTGKEFDLEKDNYEVWLEAVAPFYARVNKCL